MKKIMTSRFGEIEAAEDAVIHFAAGIPAFEEEHEFLIIPYEEDSPYVFLQSVRTPELAFLMTMPLAFFPDYEFTIDDEVEQELGFTSPEEVLIYAVLTLSGTEIRDLTANLIAPIVINAKTRKGKQIVLDRSSYTTKHRLFPAEKEDR
ncbi:flagellar assembly protein FliW [uncultured Selenomonas sp.]|uniref:flagellar assembly protein FliW n=1 Tax=uncultured Selenomonas sp. TaxID=159275 RepID=UPI0028D08E6C|nr:flagellar assembly protein FliW [uncultured Selenomonas sp.]